MTEPTEPPAGANGPAPASILAADEPDVPPPWRPFVPGRDLPWLRLFRSPGLAMDGRKLILAAVGLIATQAGWDLIARVVSGSSWTAPALVHPFPIALTTDLGALASGLAFLIAEPYLAPVSPFFALFGLGNGTITFLHAALAALWTLVVWGIVGGAISRIAVVQVATGDRVGIGTSIRFAGSRIVALVGAPASALIGLGFFAILCALPGLLYQIPGPIGAAIAGIFAFLPLLAGLVMALIVVGLAAGWPLMVATVAAEAEDGFDALSRSYSYVYQRPGRYAAYVAVSWLLGIVGLAVALLFAALVLRLTAWGLAFGGPDETIGRFFVLRPDPEITLPSTAAAIHVAWVRLVGLLAFGYAYAYFWSAISVIYLLLRLDVDGAEIEDVAMPGQDDEEFVPAEEATPVAPVEAS